MEAANETRAITASERGVAVLVAEGLTNRQIATRLGLSAETVKRHVSSLLLKFNVSRRAQIAVIADRRGWTA